MGGVCDEEIKRNCIETIFPNHRIVSSFIFILYSDNRDYYKKKQSVEDAEYGTLQTAESSAAIMSERFKKSQYNFTNNETNR
ncbi:hypothetical protein OL548_06595 [Lysinibacillus sp. MHQ-1]|nr:hypothetical protein OL548_06595 [Lysinibacillus sp. MHQ-1]